MGTGTRPGLAHVRHWLPNNTCRVVGLTATAAQYMQCVIPRRHTHARACADDCPGHWQEMCVSHTHTHMQDQWPGQAMSIKVKETLFEVTPPRRRLPPLPLPLCVARSVFFLFSRRPLLVAFVCVCVCVCVTCTCVRTYYMHACLCVHVCMCVHVLVCVCACIDVI